MTRVLVVEAAGGLWGSERALLDLIDAAVELEIAVCCPPHSPLQPELERRGVRTFPYFVAELHLKPRWERLRAAFGVLLACLRFRPDVIHLNQSGAYRVTLLAASLLNIPIVAHVRIFEDVAYLARLRPNARRLKSMIAISGAVLDEVRREPALDGIAAHCIYDAYASVGAEGSVEKRVGDRIACVGRVTPIKGQETLLAALNLAEAFPEKVECLIVGDGEPDYVRRLKALTPSSEHVRVEWTGFARDVAPLLRPCKVLVCPSHREPLGRVIFEAWDMGLLPVVFAGAGGASEIVAASGGGFIYAEQTPQCLAAALAQALALPDEEAARLVANGRAWMADHCAPGPYGRAVAAVLRQAAA